MTSSPTPTHRPDDPTGASAAGGTPRVSLPGWARLLLGPALVWALGVAALVAVFFGAVLATDCFMECGDNPRPWVGVPLAALAALPAVAAVRTVIWTVSPSAASRLGRRAWLELVGGVAAVLAAALLVQALSLEDVLPGAAGWVLLAGMLLLATRLWGVLVVLDSAFDDLTPRWRSVWLTVVWAAGLLALVAVVWTGHCSAFGGRCPAAPGPFWEDDVWTIATSYSATIAALHLLLTRRTHSWGAWAVAALSALLAGQAVWQLTLG